MLLTEITNRRHCIRTKMFEFFKTYILDFWQSNVKVFAMTSWTYAISINWINTTNLLVSKVSYSSLQNACSNVHALLLFLVLHSYMRKNFKTKTLPIWRKRDFTFLSPLESSHLMVIGKLSFTAISQIIIMKIQETNVLEFQGCL